MLWAERACAHARLCRCSRGCSGRAVCIGVCVEAVDVASGCALLLRRPRVRMLLRRRLWRRQGRIRAELWRKRRGCCCRMYWVCVGRLLCRRRSGVGILPFELGLKLTCERRSLNRCLLWGVGWRRRVAPPCAGRTEVAAAASDARLGTPRTGPSKVRWLPIAAHAGGGGGVMRVVAGRREHGNVCVE